MKTGKHNVNYSKDFDDLSRYPIGSAGWFSFLNYICRQFHNIGKTMSVIVLLFLIACGGTDEVTQVQEQEEPRIDVVTTEVRNQHNFRITNLSTFDYEGHRWIHEKEYYTSNMIHHPDCPNDN